MEALCKACERLGGPNAVCDQKQFSPVNDTLVWEPSSWEQGGWKVFTSSTPRVSMGALCSWLQCNYTFKITHMTFKKNLLWRGMQTEREVLYIG